MVQIRWERCFVLVIVNLVGHIFARLRIFGLHPFLLERLWYRYEYRITWFLFLRLARSFLLAFQVPLELLSVKVDAEESDPLGGSPPSP